MKSPKFKIGQTVSHKRDLFGCTVSKVVEITRLFDNKDGGLAYIESHMGGTRKDIKWEIIEGENHVLVIHPYASTEWSISANGFVPCMTKRREIKFDTYGYTVTSNKMNTLLSERQIKAI